MDKYAGFLIETPGDIRVKEVVEKCLGVKPGPFQTYEEPM